MCSTSRESGYWLLVILSSMLDAERLTNVVNYEGEWLLVIGDIIIDAGGRVVDNHDFKLRNNSLQRKFEDKNQL